MIGSQSAMSRHKALFQSCLVKAACAIVPFFGAVIKATAQSNVPNQTYFGRNEYIEYIAGNLPIIVAAPHGGALTPAELPDRTSSSPTDLNTEDLTRRIQQTVADRFGGYPHIIICRLKRIKIDCNREIVDGAQGNALTEISWNDYQDFIIAAKQAVTAQYGRGLFLEIHGHGHPADRLELGYLMDNDELNLSDGALNAQDKAAVSSIKHLDQISNLKFAQLLRGTASLGGLMSARGYLSVPSPEIPTPGTDEFFEGGYNCVQHGSMTAGTISAIQIECHNVGVRDNATNRQAFAVHLASALDTYLTDQFELNPTDGVPTITSLSDVTINEDTTTNALNFTVGDAVTPAGSLVVEASSSNTTLVPAANIVVTGNGANRSVTVTPAPNNFGTATITLKVQDGDLRYAQESFVLTVAADSPLTNWKQAQFGPLWTNAAISGDTVDPDYDGYANLIEYGLGGNPNASSATPLFSVRILTDKLLGTFTRTLANTDITMILQAADSPAGPWTDLVTTVNGAPVAILQPGVTTNETGTDATRTVEASDMHSTDDPAHPHRFMRMKVLR
jgi:N-formylglutamate amidohydrolase